MVGKEMHELRRRAEYLASQEKEQAAPLWPARDGDDDHDKPGDEQPEQRQQDRIEDPELHKEAHHE